MISWWWISQHVVSTLLLMGMVIVICRLFPTRPTLQHALWVVVLLKFVIPPVVVWPWPLAGVTALVSREDQAAATNSKEPRWNEVVVPTIVPSFVSKLQEHELGEVEFPSSTHQFIESVQVDSDLLSADEEKLPIPGGATSTQPISLSSSSIPWNRMILGVWIGGGLIVLLRDAIRIARCRKLLKHGVAASNPLAAEVNRLARSMGVKQLSIVTVPGLASPFVWCFGRPILIWPEQFSDETDLPRWRSVMAHELAHVKRRDHWVTWLELVAGIIWWWNPLLWFTTRQVRDTAEIACDAIALAVLPEDRRTYAETLLELSSADDVSRLIPALGAGSYDRYSFERRLKMILSLRVNQAISWRGLVLVGLLTAASLPNWSWGGEETPPVNQATVKQTTEVVSPPKGALPSPVDGPYATFDEKISENQPASSAAADDASSAKIKALEAELAKTKAELAGLNHKKSTGIVRIVPLQYRRAHDLVSMLKTAVPEIVITADPETNSVLVIDSEDAQNEIVELIGKLEESAKSAAARNKTSKRNPYQAPAPAATYVMPAYPQAATPEPVPITSPPNQLPQAPVTLQTVPANTQAPPAAVYTPTPVGANAAPASFPIASAPTTVTRQDKSTFDQNQIMQMGIALIEARGVFDLAERDWQNTVELKNKKVVSELEVKRHELSLKSANDKLHFITEFAEKVLEQTNQELKAKEAIADRDKKATERGIPSSLTLQDDSDRRALFTKKQMLESILSKNKSTTGGQSGTSETPAK